MVFFFSWNEREKKTSSLTATEHFSTRLKISQQKKLFYSESGIFYKQSNGFLSQIVSKMTYKY